MAQKKQLGAEMVAPILARKAEMADAVARTKALQQTGAPAPTVMEQLMQRNAEAEQPEPVAREMGVAQLPLKEGMYDEQRMAGGGIVAFAGGGTPETEELPPRQPGESENAYMERVRAIQQAGSAFFTPRNYNPLAKLSDLNDMYQRNIGQPFAEGVKRFINETPEEQAARFNAAKQQPKATDTQYENQGRNAYASAPMTQAPAVAGPGLPSLAKTPAKAISTAKPVEQAGPQQPTELQTLIAQAREDIEGSKTDREKAKKEAMYSRLAEAGLNIMGGQSSNFAQNIALAAPVMKGYGEDVKGIRAEERDAKKQLAALGLKGYELNQAAKKLAAEEKYMAQHGKYFEQVGAHAGDAAALRSDIATAQLDAKRMKDADSALGANLQYMKLSMSKKPEDQVKAAQIKNQVYSQYKVGAAEPSFSSGSTFNYVPGKGLIPVQ